MRTRLAIDVDEVLRDFVGQIQKLVYEETGVRTNRPRKYYYDTVEDSGVSFRKKIWDTGEWAEPVFLEAPVLEKAKSGYHLFCDDPQFEVYIVSSQSKGTEIHTDKWLLKNGFDRHIRNIYTSKKLEAPCQILIDDKIQNVKDYLDNARMGIVMDRPHNQEEQLPYRVFDLIEAYNLLK